MHHCKHCEINFQTKKSFEETYVKVAHQAKIHTLLLGVGLQILVSDVEDVEMLLKVAEFPVLTVESVFSLKLV